jgi:ferredoxin-type protein NapH
VQISSLVLFAIPMLLAGWTLLGGTVGGVIPLTTPAVLPFYGSLSSSSIAGVDLLDPFAVLQLVAASKDFAFEWLLYTLPVLLVYGLIRGRVFCGWVCPVNLVLEGVDFVRQKLKIEVKEGTVPRRAKIYVALAVLAISAVISIPLFEAFSPINAINKGLVFGSTAGLVTLGAIIVAELFWSHRVWCRSLCPLGGFYEVLGRVGVLSVRLDEAACTHCDRCKATCLADPEILDPVLQGGESVVRAGDCMLCGACIDACPTHALCVRPTLPVSYARSHKPSGQSDT